jgi:hypothetical protein
VLCDCNQRISLSFALPATLSLSFSHFPSSFLSHSLSLFLASPVTLRCKSPGKCYSLRCALPLSPLSLSPFPRLFLFLTLLSLSQCLVLSLSPRGSQLYKSRYMVFISKLCFAIGSQQISPRDSLTFFFCLLFSLLLFCDSQMYKPR